MIFHQIEIKAQKLALN